MLVRWATDDPIRANLVLAKRLCKRLRGRIQVVVRHRSARKKAQEKKKKVAYHVSRNPHNQLPHVLRTQWQSRPLLSTVVWRLGKNMFSEGPEQAGSVRRHASRLARWHTVRTWD